MDALLKDLRYGLRSLIKQPFFTVIAIATLALGVGANSAIFSVVNAVVLRPLPYPESDRLVKLSQMKLNDPEKEGSVSYLNFRDWKAQGESFDYMTAVQISDFTIKIKDSAERVPGMGVTSDFFPMLGVTPVLGRVFDAQEEKPGNQIALISQALWQSRFGSDPNIIGQSVLIDASPYTVIGVMPAGFDSPIQDERAELWLPIALAEDLLNERGANFLTVMGRLKKGVSVEQAQSEMDSVAGNLAAQYPNWNEGSGVQVTSLHEAVVGDVRLMLMVLLAAVGLVLLIACANVANLLLARATARQKEIAIRSALGASRFRVIRQLMTESLMLALIGGGLGLLLAMWGLDFLVALSPEDIPRLGEITLDSRVTAFTLLVSVVTGLIFGLAPALQVSKLDLNETLKEGSRGASGSLRRNRARSLFVIAEVALALVLLIGASLMLRSFQRLQTVDPGFKPDNVMTMSIMLPNSKYSEPEQWRGFYDRLLEQVRTLPGVESAGAITTLPLSGSNMSMSFQIEGRPPASRADEASANYRAVSYDYFSTLGVSVIRGRAFNERDNDKSPKVIMINESFARSYFPGEDPIGKRIIIGYNDTVAEIVGVAGDVKHKSLQADSGSEMYLLYQQTPWWFMSLTIRTRSNSSDIVAGVKDALATIDKDVPLYDVKAMQEYMKNTVS
ncbi:MAG TPA: ABC transporter permease, partial [Blastocatellia bacterium]